MIDALMVGLICFVVGFFAGDRFRKLKWTMLQWQVLKWHDSSLGYRLASTTTKVKKGEKVYIALKIDTEALPPGDGIQLFEEE